ncbi:uncharacterized protein LOC127809759 isoform X2 [Diospyros lotus]|uniref:uncharacterized protein LOC127809759 isoform X2 n=1 Tax=Diospyros lotus TaxID=55363 RepID=UPI00225B4965|nr:uncharacterized protein LOC127809759 isoform X2 [Diospyros lotus]
MGKVEQQQLHGQQQLVQDGGDGSWGPILCGRCSMGLCTIGRQHFNLKCVVVFVFSLSVFLPAAFWLLPLHSKWYGFDAKKAIKLSASVQAYFRVEKPVSDLVPQIQRLEYDINGEIGVPSSEVRVLSMHPAGANWTDVVFGILSDPIDASLTPVSLSLLRSSLIELFLQQFNLTLTSTIFGLPSSFEILKFPGGITVIPEQSVSVWPISEFLFNFTLHNSICEIKERLFELKEQLKLGLHLRSYENVYVQLTNGNGSTIDPPVTVQAAVISDMGRLLPLRLKQLAQAIIGSPPAKNLGLSNSVFGKVKEISLSSYLSHTIHATPPRASPAPAPEKNDYAGPAVAPSPHLAPSYSPAPAPDFHCHHLPCHNCYISSPSNEYPTSPSPENRPCYSLLPTSSSPAPSRVGTPPPCPSHYCDSSTSPSPSPTSNSDLAVPPAFSPHASSSYPRPLGPRPQFPPNLSPLPVLYYASSRKQEKGNAKGLSPPVVSPSPSPDLANHNIPGSLQLLP